MYQYDPFKGLKRTVSVGGSRLGNLTKGKEIRIRSGGTPEKMIKGVHSRSPSQSRWYYAFQSLLSHEERMDTNTRDIAGAGEWPQT